MPGRAPDMVWAYPSIYPNHTILYPNTMPDWAPDVGPKCHLTRGADSRQGHTLRRRMTYELESILTSTGQLLVMAPSTWTLDVRDRERCERRLSGMRPRVLYLVGACEVHATAHGLQNAVRLLVDLLLRAQHTSHAQQSMHTTAAPSALQGFDDFFTRDVQLDLITIYRQHPVDDAV